MTETPATLHPLAPAPCSRHPALAPRCLGSLPASPGDALVGTGRGTFTTPRLCGWMWALLSITAWHPLSRWPWPIWHHFHFLGSCQKALSGSGMVLGPSPQAGVSELAWMADRCLTRATGIPRRTQPQPPPGGVRTKAATTSPAQGMHFSRTWFREGPPWPLPKSSGWAPVVVVSLSQLGVAWESGGVKAAREDMGASGRIWTTKHLGHHVYP